jgi:hypothetical protein
MKVNYKNPFKRMEQLIYFFVKIIAAFYLLYRTAWFLYWTWKKHFWRFLTPPAKGKANVLPAKPETDIYTIVGKSQTMYLKEKTGVTEPAFSENLQQTSAYEEDPDITAEDVEDNLDGEDISAEDRFLPLNTIEDDGGVSTGMTFEQLSDTFDVVKGKQTGSAGLQAAARILYEIRGSDLFDFLAAQAENERVIEQLIRENLDDSGNPIPENGRKRRNTPIFDIDKYV